MNEELLAQSYCNKMGYYPEDDWSNQLISLIKLAFIAGYKLKRDENISSSNE